jgi:hypothetical protein
LERRRLFFAYEDSSAGGCRGQASEQLVRGRNDALFFLDPRKMFSAGPDSKRFKESNRHRNRHPTMDATRRERKIAPRRKHNEVPRLKDMTVKDQTIGNFLVLKNKGQGIRRRNAVQDLGASLHAKLQDDRIQFAMTDRPGRLTGSSQQEVHRRSDNHVRIFVKAKAV